MEILLVVSNVVMAMCYIILLWSLRQIRIASSSQSLNALENVHRHLEEIKILCNEIYRWNPVSKPINATLENPQEREIIRKVSVCLNQIGFLVWKNAVDIDLITDNCSDIYIKAFHSLKPYLERERELRGERGKVWYIRKYFLLMVPLCQDYMRKHHRDHDLGNPSLYPDLVNVDMLEIDSLNWLRKKKIYLHNS